MCKVKRKRLGRLVLMCSIAQKSLNFFLSPKVVNSEKKDATFIILGHDNNHLLSSRPERSAGLRGWCLEGGAENSHCRPLGHHRCTNGAAGSPRSKVTPKTGALVRWVLLGHTKRLHTGSILINGIIVNRSRRNIIN